MKAKKPAPGDEKRALAYLRVSTDEQKDGLIAQRHAIERWAARENVEIVCWREEEDVSGGVPLEKRLGLLAAIEELGPNRCGIFLVSRRDRLARSVIVAAIVERLCQRQGARIVSTVGEGTETDEDDPTGFLQRHLADGFAQYERLIIKARTKAALAVKRARGDRTGTIPYGKAVAEDGVKLFDSPEEQVNIRTIGRLRRSGLSIRQIAAELSLRGVPTRTGGAWHPTQISRIIAGIATVHATPKEPTR